MAANSPFLYHAAILTVAGGCIYNASQGARTGEISFFYTKVRRSVTPALFWFVVFHLAAGGLAIALVLFTGVLG